MFCSSNISFLIGYILLTVAKFSSVDMKTAIILNLMVKGRAQNILVFFVISNYFIISVFNNNLISRSDTFQYFDALNNGYSAFYIGKKQFIHLFNYKKKLWLHALH